MNGGWIKIHRKMVDWEWYDDINVKVVFLHLLLTCNYEEKTWHGKTIRRGQRVTSFQNLAEETQLTVQQVRTALDKLKSTHELTIKSTNKYTLVTIEKYSDYQDVFWENNKQLNKQYNKRITTTKEYKEEKKKRSIYNIFHLKDLNGLYDN